MKIVRESLDFERSQNPIDALNIGIKKKIYSQLRSFVDNEMIGGTGLGDPRFMYSFYPSGEDSFCFYGEGGKNYINGLIKKYGLDQYFDGKGQIEEKTSNRYTIRFKVKKELQHIFEEIPTSFHFIKMEESLDFERHKEPFDALSLGIYDKVKKGLNCLRLSPGIGSISIMSNKDEVWLSIDDYNGNGRFTDYLYQCLSPNYFEGEVEHRDIMKRGGSWRSKFIVYVSSPYWDAFKAAFDPNGGIRESVNFERTGEPLKKLGIGRSTPGVGQFAPAYLEGRGLCNVLKVEKYKDLTPEEKDSLAIWYGSSLMRNEKDKTNPNQLWVEIMPELKRKSVTEVEEEWMDVDRFEILKKKGRWMDPQWRKSYKNPYEPKK
jgi:hypothetical protein